MVVGCLFVPLYFALAYSSGAKAWMWAGAPKTPPVDLPAGLAAAERERLIGERRTRVWSHCVTHQPRSSLCWAQLAVALEDAGDDRSGSAAYERAASMLQSHDNQAVTMLNGAALGRMRLGEYEAALQTYGRALEAAGGSLSDWGPLLNDFPEPNCAMKIMDGLGLALSALGDPNSAMQAHLAAESLVGTQSVDFISARLFVVDDVNTLNNLGAALLTAGDAQGAAARLKAASELVHRLPPTKRSVVVEVYYNLGIALRRVNELAGAIAAYSRAIEIEPGRADIYLNRGVALQAAGDFTAATASLQHAVALGHPKRDAILGAIAQMQRGA